MKRRPRPGRAGSRSSHLLQSSRYYVELLGLRGKRLLLLLALLAIGWIIAGTCRVQPNEQGVVLRLGKWLETTTGRA